MTLNPKEEAVLSLIGEDTSYENYFFKRVSDIKWFEPLKSRSYFSPQKALSPKAAGQEGFYMIPEWNVLPYLERVSQQINIAANEHYIDELLGIIKEVTEYHVNHNQVLDNYRTWYYFTKIMLNLPNEKIPEEIISLIPIWLDSNFDTILQGSEIAIKLLPKFLTDKSEDLKKAEKIIKFITATKKIPLNKERADVLGKTEELKLVIDSHWLKEAFKKYSGTIGEKCSKGVIEDLTNKIRALLKNEGDGTYQSFYDEPAYSIDDPVEMFTFILKRVMLAKAENDVGATKKLLKEFLEDAFLYFPKMSLYIIGRDIEKYDELFWKIIETNTGDAIFEKTLHFGDELKHLLMNLSTLTDEQRKLLVNKIEDSAKNMSIRKIPKNPSLCINRKCIELFLMTHISEISMMR